MVTHPLVQQEWSRRTCPGFSAIYFGDGSVIIMECVTEGGDGPNDFTTWVRPVARSTIESVFEFGEPSKTSIHELVATEPTPTSRLVACAGEGSWGSEGFVALVDVRSNSLVWVALFQQSNPFVRVELHDDQVIAWSTYGLEWTFPIGRPEQVVVERSSGDGGARAEGGK